MIVRCCVGSRNYMCGGCAKKNKGGWVGGAPRVFSASLLRGPDSDTLYIIFEKKNLGDGYGETSTTP